MSDCARYFFAVYGAVDTSGELPKPEVESGSCPMFKPYISNLGIKSGDIMLLYCTNGYPNLAYRKAASGVGLVESIDTGRAIEYVYYKYVSLPQPVALSSLRLDIPELKKTSRAGVKYKRILSRTESLLFEISRESFQNAVPSYETL